jgi:(p)ppGpp synthase/HD superfamily hydrolase
MCLRKEISTMSAFEEKAVCLGQGLAEVEGPAERQAACLDDWTPAPYEFGRPTLGGPGLAAVAAELQDAWFAILLPAEYERVARSVKRTLADEADRLVMLATSLERLVRRDGIACALQSRIKGLYSLYRKMVRKHRCLGCITDLAGVRIIVRSIDDCYRVLGLVHTHYAYVPGTFDDYIGAPKRNGYRSLHTCVSVGDALTAEIQIRTLTMHLEAEYGRAAHWRYKRAAAHPFYGSGRFLV